MQIANEYRISRTHPDKPDYFAPNWAGPYTDEDAASRTLVYNQDCDTDGYEYRIERRTVTYGEWAEVEA